MLLYLTAIMLITLGSISDLSSFLRIEQEAFPVDGYDLKTLRKYIKNAFICLKMVNPENKDVVGYCVCNKIKQSDLEPGFKKGIEIASFALLPAYQGKRYGTQLMHWIMTAVAEQDIDYIELQVDTSNSAAIHLYENFEFQISDTLTHYYNESGHDAFVMVWRKSSN
jgi:ribosomal-protein-alanine N-acetyltransferase